MKRLHVNAGRRSGGATAVRTEHVSSALLELIRTSCDLIGVNVELLSNLRHRPVAVEGGHRRGAMHCIDATFALKAGLLFRRGRLVIGAPE